jgi:hypothetical protein
MNISSNIMVLEIPTNFHPAGLGTHHLLLQLLHRCPPGPHNSAMPGPLRQTAANPTVIIAMHLMWALPSAIWIIGCFVAGLSSVGFR